LQESELRNQELDVVKGLGLEYVLTPVYDLETGGYKFDEAAVKDGLNLTQRDSDGRILNEDEMDIFELARMR
jgi:hypothetical protein